MLKPQRVPVDINEQLRTSVKEEKHARFSNGSNADASTRIIASLNFEENHDLNSEKLLHRSQRVY